MSPLRSTADWSLRSKLLLVIGLASMAALGVGFAAFLTYDAWSYNRQLANELETIAKLFARSAAAAVELGDPEDARDTLAHAASVPSVVGAAVYTADGELFADFVPPGGAASAPLLPEGGETVTRRGGHLVVAAPVEAGRRRVGTVVLESDRRLAAVRQRVGVIGALTVLVLAFLVAFAVSTRLQRIVSGPILGLARAAEGVSAQQDYSIRVPRATGDEVGQLTSAFNQMLEQIESRDKELVHARDHAQTAASRARELAAEARESKEALEAEMVERERAAAALREREARLRTLFEGIHDALLVYATDGRVLDCNEAASETLGFTRERLLALSLLDIDPNMSQEGLAGLFEEGTTVREGMHATSAGTRIPVEVHTGVIEYEGQPALLSVARNITERVTAEQERMKLERQVQDKQKLESLGVLAGGIAHDFNNLLTGILGNASLAGDQVEPGSEAAESLELIREAAERAADLTGQLLAYSGKGRFVVQPIDLSAIASEMKRLLGVAISKSARLEFELADDLPLFDGDVTQVRQVVMNLITNASDAIVDERSAAREGTIKVRTGVAELSEEDRDLALLAPESGQGLQVFLEVEDDGCGMDAQARERILDPFFTTKFTGRGLGLAAVMGIVRGHDGALLLETEPGKGSRFRVLFPATGAARAAKPAEPLAGSAGEPGHGTILVADDEPMVLSLARRALLGAGYSVLTATDGYEAVEVFRAHAGEIRLVLLDMSMPRMSGPSAAREIRALEAKVPVILSSGYSEEETLGEVEAGAVAGFVAKPYRPATLLRSVSEVLRRACVEPGS